MPLNIIRKIVYGERDDFEKKIKYDTDCLVAESLIAPKEALIVLSKDPSWVIRDKVASNPITPKEALITLSKDKYYWVRDSVASNPSTPIEILIEFSKDEDLRKSVARNPSTPIEILVTLSQDKNWFVRKCVALNSNTPIDILTTLSKDEDSRVRMGVAKNPNTPKEALIILSQGQDDNINKIALKRLEELNLPENKIESTEEKISNNKNTLENLFKEKNIDPNSEIGLELLKVYNDTQDKLKLELEDLKTQVVDIATNDFLER